MLLTSSLFQQNHFDDEKNKEIESPNGSLHHHDQYCGIFF